MATAEQIATVRNILADTIKLPSTASIAHDDFLDQLCMDEWEKREALFDAIDVEFGTHSTVKRIQVMTYGDLLALVDTAS